MTTGGSNRSVLALVAMIVFLDIAGLGLILPVMPRLIMSLTGVTIDRAAEIGGWLLFSYAVMQFLFAPVIGGLSDRFGRRPVLLFTLFALGIDYALMAWAPTLGWLFVGRVISGVMGATFAAANSCIADIVPPAERGRAFGALGGAGAAGFVLGPGIGGLLGGLGERVPFMAASGVALTGAQGFAVGPLVKRFGARRVAVAGLACGIPCYLILATAPNTALMIVGMAIGAGTGVTFPAMQQMMTHRVPEDSQGELQGAIASVISLTSIIGPPIMTGVFGAFADARGVYFPGAPFLLAAMLLGIGWAALIVTMTRHGGEAATSL